jgi:hypothetical protein
MGYLYQKSAARLLIVWRLEGPCLAVGVAVRLQLILRGSIALSKGGGEATRRSRARASGLGSTSPS